MLTPRHPVLVGVTGFAQSGKSSCGQVFEHMGYTPRAFADPLRQMAEDLNPILGLWDPLVGDECPTYNQLLKAYGYERAKAEVDGFRDFLKDLGQSARKRIGDEVWVRACLDNARRNSVITDVRFANEAEAVRRRAMELGGKALILRVERPGVTSESDFEIGIPFIQVDAVVKNDGSLEDLESKLYELAGEWMVENATGQLEFVLSRSRRDAAEPEAPKRSRFFPTVL